MRIETGGRQSGKTTTMIQWLQDNPYGVLYVHNEDEARRLRESYDPEGIMELANRIVSVTANRRRSFHYPKVAIDNADLVLREMFGDIEVVTMTDATLVEGKETT